MLSFQFHKGTIRTEIRLSVVGTFCYFNCIKVRLELVTFSFLSQAVFNFNSIKVRLEHTMKNTSLSVSLISIP